MSESSDIYYYDLIVSHFKDNINFTKEQFLAAKYKARVLEFNCSVCGKSFYYSKDEICTKLKRSKYPEKNLAFKYCSKQCQTTAYTVTKPCLQCGKPVTKRKCDAERFPNFFCNKSCAAVYNNTHRTVDYTNTFTNKRKYTEYNGIDLTSLSSIEYQKIHAKIRHNKKRKCVPKTQKSPIKKKKLLTQKTPKPKKIKLCKVCGLEQCSNPHICKWNSLRNKSLNLQLLGFDFSTYGTPDIVESYTNFRQKMLTEYSTMSMTQIRKQYNIKADKTIQDIFKYLNIPLVDASEQLRKYLDNGGTLFQTNGAKCTPYIKQDGTTIMCRSSYEVDFANHLEELDIAFEFENKRILFKSSIDNKIHYAFPDFYIPNANTIIEVKSWYYYDQLRMVDRFNAYKAAGYIPKLLLEGKMYSVPPKSKKNTIFAKYPNKV